MKKLLALVLALVMSMSLVTISNAAFKDADKIDYDEAVEVMNAIGVLVGDEKGNFNAKENLTREQAAKIISYLLLGNKTAEALVGAAKFTDVAATRWSAGFVDYCASTGVVAGNGDGTFAPAGQLTGFQFAKMLLVALGYDAKIEGFTGTDWQINVSKVANQVGLFNGLSISGTAVLTREQAAQMCLNTIKAPLVEYSNKGGNLTVNGATINIGASKAEYVTTTLAKEQRISDKKLTNTGLNTTGGYTVEFGEKYYPALELKSGADAFGRPSNEWLHNNKKIGTYADYSTMVAEYTAKVTGKEVYDVLGKSVVSDYDIDILINGDENTTDYVEIAKNNKDTFSETAKGVLTQVFVDDDAKQVTIVEINTYLAQAKADYNTKTEKVNLTIYGLTGYNGTVTADDFEIEDVKEDDFFLVTYAQKEVQSLAIPEVVADTAVTAFSKGNYVVAGSKYEYSAKAAYKDDVLDAYSDNNMKDTTYNVYLDQYGYLIGIDKVKSATNYVFITGMDTGSSNLTGKTADAFAIFTDGTTETIKVNTSKSFEDDGTTLMSAHASSVMNTWCTYTVDKNGVYTLTEVATSFAAGKVGQTQKDNTVTIIDKKHISLDASSSKVYGNDNSVYLTAKLDSFVARAGGKTVAISGVSNIVTGVKNVSLKTYNDSDVKGLKSAYSDADNANVASGYYALYNKNGYVIAAVCVAKDDAVAKNLVYTASYGVNLESYADGEWTWSRDVIAKGEKVTLLEKGDTLSTLESKNLKSSTWYQISYDANNYVVGAAEIKDDTIVDKYANNSDAQTAVNDAVKAIEKGDDVVIIDTKADNAEPKMIGSTLYLNTTKSTGIFVAEDAKIALIQTNNNKTTTEFFEGVKNVEGVIDQLNAAADGKYDYEFDAVVEEGATTVIVIKDKNSDGYTLPDANKEPKLTATAKVNGMTVEVPVVDGFQDTVADKAIAALQDAGYTVTGVKLNGKDSNNNDKYTLTATKGAVSGYEFNTLTTVYYLASYKVTSSSNAKWNMAETAVEYVPQKSTTAPELTLKVAYDGEWADSARNFTVKANTTAGISSDTTVTSGTPVNNASTVKVTLGTTITGNFTLELTI